MYKSVLRYSKKGLLKCYQPLFDTQEDVIIKPDSIESFTPLALIIPY